MTKLAEKKLRELGQEVVDLISSPLYDYRQENNYLPVVGEGNPQAEIIFVGEAPGRREAECGRPFCGAAGKILDTLLVEAGLKREEVYITSIIKDRPPKNRDPLPEEIALYGPFLDRQIEIIQPAVIATLGRFSMNYILETFAPEETLQPIGARHGKVIKGKASYGPIKILPLYHPAAAIYNQKLKPVLAEDFKVLKKLSR
jgi:uracil-DNA glycosylase